MIEHEAQEGVNRRVSDVGRTRRSFRRHQLPGARRSEVVDVIAVIRAVTVSAVRRATPTIPDCVFKCEC
jgi:hypothetical protein